MGAIKEIRIEKKLTQQQVADMVGISLRSYKSYENDEETDSGISDCRDDNKHVWHSPFQCLCALS